MIKANSDTSELPVRGSHRLPAMSYGEGIPRAFIGWKTIELPRSRAESLAAGASRLSSCGLRMAGSCWVILGYGSGVAGHASAKRAGQSENVLTRSRSAPNRGGKPSPSSVVRMRIWALDPLVREAAVDCRDPKKEAFGIGFCVGDDVLSFPKQLLFCQIRCFVDLLQHVLLA